MDVRTFTVGPVAENCHIARRDGARAAVMIDPGDEPDRLLAALPDDTRVLPGHMGETTLGRERATNPFLHQLA